MDLGLALFDDDKEKVPDLLQAGNIYGASKPEVRHDWQAVVPVLATFCVC